MLTFTNPLLLWAFPVLVLPWIFRRRREERILHIDFPLLRFLRESEEKERVNPFLQELLLLLLRTMLLAMLLLALAGPKWTVDAPGRKSLFSSLFSFGRMFQSHVLVLDTSYSMGYGTGETSWFHQARQAWDLIERNIRGLSLDRVQWDRTTVAPDRSSRLFSLSSREIETLFQSAPSAEGTSVPELMTASQRSFDDAHSMILVTDGQRLPWAPLLDSSVDFKFPASLLAVSVGEKPVVNRWCEVKMLSSPPWGIAGWETIAGQTRSLGGDGVSGTVSIIHAESGDPAYSDAVSFPASPNAVAALPFLFTSRFSDLMARDVQRKRPDVLKFSIKLEPADPLPIDNEMTLEVPVIENFSLAILCDAAVDSPVLSILTSALNPLAGSPQSPPVRLENLNPPLREISESVDLAVIVPSLVSTWSPLESTAAMEYIKNGGAAIIFTIASEMELESWNRFLTELGWVWNPTEASAAPEGVAVSSAGLLTQSLKVWEESIWKPWLPKRHGNLKTGASLVSYRLGDQSCGLIAEASLGKGKFWLVNTSLALDSETLLSPALPPFLWETAKEAARLKKQYALTLPAPKPESNLTLLTDQEKSQLSERYGVQFTGMETLEKTLNSRFGGTDLRMLLLFLCVLLGLTESWLSNHLASI
ncbi:MAG: BatA domain-containing protein [Candidatus Omnitrophota bacterium]